MENQKDNCIVQWRDNKTQERAEEKKECQKEKKSFFQEVLSEF